MLELTLCFYNEVSGLTTKSPMTSLVKSLDTFGSEIGKCVSLLNGETVLAHNDTGLCADIVNFSFILLDTQHTSTKENDHEL